MYYRAPQYVNPRETKKTVGANEIPDGPGGIDLQ